MTTEPEIQLSAEEIAEPYGAAILAKFALCVARKCGHDITHHTGNPRRYLATIAAKDAEIAELHANAELMKFMEAQMLRRFADNPDAHSWMGWRTQPDGEGRQFDLTVQLVSGEMALDRYVVMEAALREAEERSDALRRARAILDVATDDEVLAFIRAALQSTQKENEPK